jgi:integrase
MPLEFPVFVTTTRLPVIRFHDYRHTAASIMLSHGIPPIIVAGMLGHSLAILMTTYAHYIPGTQDEAARLMDEILTPIPIDLKSYTPKAN